MQEWHPPPLPIPPETLHPRGTHDFSGTREPIASLFGQESPRESRQVRGAPEREPEPETRFPRSRFFGAASSARSPRPSQERWQRCTSPSRISPSRHLQGFERYCEGHRTPRGATPFPTLTIWLGSAPETSPQAQCGLWGVLLSDTTRELR